MSALLKNPFVIYIASFGGMLAVYQLGWSELYPPLSPAILWFFAASFLLAGIFAVMVSHEVGAPARYSPGLMPSRIVYFLAASFVADLLYTGEIPLVSMLFGGDFQHDGEIGVPTLHVFNVTFGSAFATIRFCDFLYSKRRPRYLLEALIPIIFFVLVVYRGAILIVFVSWAFVFIIKSGMTAKRGILICAAAAAALFAFGALGDLREGPEAVEKLGKPSDAFRNSGVPKPYFWAYIYLTSPLANLQLTIDLPEMEQRSVTEFVISEMLPDFISNRALPLLHSGHPTEPAERIKTPEVSPGLNVATIYGRPSALLGWTGIWLLFAELFSLIILYIWLIRNSPYRVPCLALLNTFIVFCTFQNMISYTALLMQLVWPLFIPHWTKGRAPQPRPITS